VHDGLAYEVRAERANDNGILIRAHIGDEPATRFTYSISWEEQLTAAASDVIGFGSMLEALADLAEADVREGREQRFGDMSDRRKLSGNPLSECVCSTRRRKRIGGM
jgi:hypothetical protein